MVRSEVDQSVGLLANFSDRRDNPSDPLVQLNDSVTVLPVVTAPNQPGDVPCQFLLSAPDRFSTFSNFAQGYTLIFLFVEIIFKLHFPLPQKF